MPPQEQPTDQEILSQIHSVATRTIQGYHEVAQRLEADNPTALDYLLSTLEKVENLTQITNDPSSDFEYYASILGTLVSHTPETRLDEIVGILIKPYYAFVRYRDNPTNYFRVSHPLQGLLSKTLKLAAILPNQTVLIPTLAPLISELLDHPHHEVVREVTKFFEKHPDTNTKEKLLQLIQTGDMPSMGPAASALRTLPLSQPEISLVKNTLLTRIKSAGSVENYTLTGALWFIEDHITIDDIPELQSLLDYPHLTSDEYTFKSVLGLYGSMYRKKEFKGIQILSETQVETMLQMIDRLESTTTMSILRIFQELHGRNYSQSLVDKVRQKLLQLTERCLDEKDTPGHYHSTILEAIVVLNPTVSDIEDLIRRYMKSSSPEIQILPLRPIKPVQRKKEGLLTSEPFIENLIETLRGSSQPHLVEAALGYLAVATKHLSYTKHDLLLLVNQLLSSDSISVDLLRSIIGILGEYDLADKLDTQEGIKQLLQTSNHELLGPLLTFITNNPKLPATFISDNIDLVARILSVNDQRIITQAFDIIDRAVRTGHIEYLTIGGEQVSANKFQDVVRLVSQIREVRKLRPILGFLVQELCFAANPEQVLRRIQAIYLDPDLPIAVKQYEIFTMLYRPQRVIRILNDEKSFRLSPALRAPFNDLDVDINNPNPDAIEAVTNEVYPMLRNDMLKLSIVGGDPQIREIAETMVEFKELMVSIASHSISQLEQIDPTQLQRIGKVLRVCSTILKADIDYQTENGVSPAEIVEIAEALLTQDSFNLYQACFNAILPENNLALIDWEDVLERMNSARRTAHDRNTEFYHAQQLNYPLAIKAVQGYTLLNYIDSAFYAREFSASPDTDATAFDSDTLSIGSPTNLPDEVEAFADQIKKYGDFIITFDQKSAAGRTELVHSKVIAENHVSFRSGIAVTDIVSLHYIGSEGINTEQLELLKYKIAVEFGFFISIFGADKQPLFTPDDYDLIRSGETYYIEIGGKMGSNDGALCLTRTPDGMRKCYIKYSEEDYPHNLFNEHIANEIYRRLGINVPETDVQRISVMTANGEVERWGHISMWLDGADNVRASTDSSWLQGFIADAFLANWDIPAAPKRNTKATVDGIYRIDNGGAILYRARGDRKPQFPPVVSELESIRHAYRGLSTEVEYKQAAHLVNTLTDSAIADIVDSVPLTAADRAETINSLIARREYIAAYYLQEAEETGTPELPPTLLTVVNLLGRIDTITDAQFDHELGGLVTEWSTLIGEYGFQHNKELLGKHIKDVIRSIVRDPAFQDLSIPEQTITLLGALFHDICKPTDSVDSHIPRDYNHEMACAETAATYLQLWGADNHLISSVIQLIIYDGVTTDMLRGTIRPHDSKSLTSIELARRLSLPVIKSLRILNRADASNTNRRGFQQIQDEYERFFDEAEQAST